VVHVISESAHQFELEVLTLLVVVAWADQQIDDREVAVVLELARSSGASDVEIETLRAGLADRYLLPAPNFQLLRARRDEVMALVDQMIGADRQVVADEKAVRAAILRLLSDD